MGPWAVIRRSEFGSLVRAYRREAGLTQRELAAKTGLSVAALRDFEQSPATAATQFAGRAGQGSRP